MLLTLLLACRPATKAERNVIVVIVDGVRVDESISTEISELSGVTGREMWPQVFSELAPEGTLLTNVRNQGTTVTAPAHAAMFTGARIALGNMAVDEGVGLYRPERPTLGEEVRRQLELDPQGAVVMANQSLISPMTYSTMPGYGPDLGATWFHVVSSPDSDRPAPQDAQVFSTLEKQLDTIQPRLVVANLKAVDRTGHYGDTVDDYLVSIEKVDGPLVALWETLQADPAYSDNTVLIITSDHGRHREGDPGADEYWRNHGTSVEGDRQVPMLLVGPGIRAGVEDDTPYALTDLAPTVAALFNAEMPWAEGMAMNVALTDEAPIRTGIAEVAASRATVLAVEYTDDAGARSVVTWNGEVVSSTEAWAAEGVAVVESEGVVYGCWRELVQQDDASPWVPWCAMDDGSGRVSLGSPVEEVNPHWVPDLRVTESGLELSFIDNPDDIAQPGVDGEVGPIWLRWRDEAWETGRDGEPELRYPTDATTVTTSTGMVTAFVASTYSNNSRGTRRVYLQRARWGETFEVTAPAEVDLSAIAPVTGEWRVERPALRVDEDHVELLMIGMTEFDRVLLHVESTDGGETWSAADVLVSDDTIPLHLGPLWAGDEPAWVSASGLCTRGGCEAVSGPVKDWAWDGEDFVAVVGEGLDWSLR